MDTRESSAPTRPTESPATRLTKLEERLANELLDEEERCELVDIVARVRRRLGL